MAHRPARPAVPTRLRAAVPTRLRAAVPTRLRVTSPDSVAPEGPHVRLGLVWAAVTTVAAAKGPVALAAVLAPVAALAAAQAARSWRRRERRAAVPVSAGGAALVVITAAFGLTAVGVAVLVVAALLALARVTHAQPPSRVSLMLTGLIALGCGVAGAAPVLLRETGFIPVFVLLSFIHVYDASAYVVGAGAATPWEGPAAGVASIAAVTLAVAAVLSPPFRGASPWLFGLLAAALVPLGPLAAAELIGDRRARLPALRRLDSLLVAGPLWALAVSLVLD